MIKNIILKGLLYLFLPLYLYPQQVDSLLFYYNKAEESYNKFDNYSALKYYIKALPKRSNPNKEKFIIQNHKTQRMRL